MSELDISPTPNPNSLKFTHSEKTFIPSGMESFDSPEGAAGHPLGASLFSIRGVLNVFVMPQFMTVTKTPEANWDDILPKIGQAVEAWLQEA